VPQLVSKGIAQQCLGFETIVHEHFHLRNVKTHSVLLVKHQFMALNAGVAIPEKDAEASPVAPP
jgi:hypothetical protein